VTPSDAEGFFPPVYGVPGRTIKQRLDVWFNTFDKEIIHT
jgi:hypothetical protein